jgi:hypothetical protein
VVFIGVLGAALKTFDPLTLYTSFADHIFGNAGWVQYLIGIPLVFALPASVLIASTGEPIPAAAVSRAAALCDGQPVAVVSLARIYGSALGLPNPGLLPTQRELADQRERVASALAGLERAGVEGWGQVAATRRPGRSIARVARARGVRHVILVTPSQPGWRRFVEGNLVREISRKLAPGTSVDAVIVLRPG